MPSAKGILILSSLVIGFGLNGCKSGSAATGPQGSAGLDQCPAVMNFIASIEAVVLDPNCAINPAICDAQALAIWNTHAGCFPWVTDPSTYNWDTISDQQEQAAMECMCATGGPGYSPNATPTGNGYSPGSSPSGTGYNPR